MKKQQQKTTYFFVDESGDPYFYDRKGNFIVGKEGCSKLLILGFIRTEEPELLRKSILKLREDLSKDPYLEKIPSLSKSLKYFHATDDSPEVREKVFKGILDLPFKAEFIVARKIESLFIKRHKKNPNFFYDDIISKLFQNQLHSSSKNVIYFSVRTNRARQAPLEMAIKNAIQAFEVKWKTSVKSVVQIYPQRPQTELCLQIIDYIIWTVQRAFVKREDRYYQFIKDKISLIADIYDYNEAKNTYYTRKNLFDLKKISPL